jgi:hypothetical protein
VIKTAAERDLNTEKMGTDLQDEILKLPGVRSERKKDTGAEAAAATEEAEAPSGDAAEEETVTDEEGETPEARDQTPEKELAEEADEVETAAEEAEAEADPEKPAKNATQKRIDELTARSKTAEDELAAANERIASFEAASNGRFDAGQLDHVDSVDALGKTRADIVDLHQRLLRSPGGITLPDPADPTKTIEYDAAGVGELLGETFKLIHEDIPAREKFLAKKGEFDAAAVNAYPWLKDTKQGAGAQVQALLQSNPALRKVGPNYKLVAADALIGQTLRAAGVQVTPELIKRLTAEVKSQRPEARGQKPEARPAIRRTPPASPARTGMVPPRSSAATQKAAVDKRLSKGTGNIRDLTASIAASM